MIATNISIRKLAGRRLTLAPFSDRHISDAYLGWMRDETITRYLVKGGPSTTLTEVRAYCETIIVSHNDFFFAIVRNDLDQHIGNVRLGPVNFAKEEAHFGILIGDAASHGSGYGAETVDLVTDFCFKDLRLRRLSFPVVSANEPAMRLYEKCGFTNEGPSPEKFAKDGVVHPMVQWAKHNPAKRGKNP